MGMGQIIQQTLCRLAALVETSAAAAGIARGAALLIETAFIPALKDFSIAGRQRAIVCLITAVQTVKFFTAKHPSSPARSHSRSRTDPSAS